MATRGWEVSRCFFEISEKALSNSVFIIEKRSMKDENKDMIESEVSPLDIDFTDADEARRAFIASEIFNKKY